MAYCTKSDILEQLDEDDLIQLTDDTDAGTVDDDKVDRAIADADAEIDSYCGTRYTVPFATVPDIVRKYSVDIAIFNLYARRHGVPEDRQKRYDNAIRFFRDVATNKASLGENDPDGNPPDSDAPQMSTDNPERIFTRDKMKGF